MMTAYLSFVVRPRYHDPLSEARIKNKMYKYLIIAILLIVFSSCGRKSYQFQKNNLLDIKHIITERGITENLDSLVNRRFDTLRTQLQIQLSKHEIEEKLEGNWVPVKSTRINGREAKIFNNTKYTFDRERRFIETKSDGTINKGEYSIKHNQRGNLELHYDDPQIPNYPKEYLEQMTIEEIKQASYSTGLLNIFEVSENELLLYTVLPLIDYSNPALITHSRLIIEKLKKE